MQYRVVAADAFSTQRQLLWDLSYRATGTVADADLLLRECFTKAVERPLAERDADWRRHLIRSAATLAVETLRQRKRRHYAGPWLPAPIETGNAASASSVRSEGAAARYDLVESGTFAFLKALELLEPRERLVFVLSDALGFEIRDVAAALDLTTGTSRTVLQNARRKMHAYDTEHVPPTSEAQTHVAAVLRDCLVHVQNSDASRLEKILAIDAQAMFDGGGEFVAPPGTIFGSAAVARVLTKFADAAGPASFSFRMLNGLPAALGQVKARPKWARQFVFRIEARDGLITETHVIMTTPKLTAVRFDPL